MRGIIWFIVAAVVAVWSLVSWLAYQLIVAGGKLVASNADLAPVPPEAIEIISWLGLFGANAGGWVIALIWALVSAIILALGFVVTRLVPGARRY